MAIFTKQFANADDYEDWLEQASGKVNVLSIVKTPTVYKSSSIKPHESVILKYQTHDKAFAPPRGASGKVMEYAIVGAAFFALFAYMIAEL